MVVVMGDTGSGWGSSRWGRGQVGGIHGGGVGNVKEVRWGGHGIEGGNQGVRLGVKKVGVVAKGMGAMVLGWG